MLVVDGTFFTIPTVEILRGGSFLFPPEPYSSSAVKQIVLIFTVLILAYNINEAPKYEIPFPM